MEKSSSIPLQTLANEIRTLYKSDPLESAGLIELYLEERWKELMPAERLALLERLTEKFKDLSCPSPRAIHPEMEREEFSRLFSMLLGRRITVEDLSSTELLERLAHSLNMIFDTLNQITGVIHSTLLGKKMELETIRQIIGSDLQENRGTSSLQDFLDQIQEAFLVAHQALQQAAHTKVQEILHELDPKQLDEAAGGGFKLGPFRKAELLEIYKERFSKCQGWFDSGRFLEELLREFERICQKQYKFI